MAVGVLATGAPTAGPARAEPDPAELRFIHGAIDGPAFIASICADVDRRSTAALCDDDSARVVRGLERARCAHWMMLGREALWAAKRRGDVSPRFARTMQVSCLAADRATDG